MAGGNIGSYGCVVCSFAMCMSAIAGKEITPPTVLSSYSSCFPGGLASWSNWPAAAQSIGGNAYAVKNRQAVLDALSKGHLVIVWARKTLLNGKVITNWSLPDGPRSSGQHAIVIVSGSGDTVYINDPANENRSSVAQPISSIPDSYQSLELEMWAFSGANGAAISKGGTFTSSGDSSSSSDGDSSSEESSTPTGLSILTSKMNEKLKPITDAITKAGEPLTKMLDNILGTNSSSSSDESGSDSSSGGTITSAGSDSGGTLTGGSDYPKYTDLTDSQKKFIAGVSSAEQDSSDIAAQRLEVSQMANLNEVEYNRSNSGNDLLKTLKGGWYAQRSLNKANAGEYSQQALQAVDEVLVQGKRTIPRHVTEHDFYGDITNINLNPSTEAGKANRKKMKPGDRIKNSMGSSYQFYTFAGKNGADGYGDPFGSKDQYVKSPYTEDVPWGSGRGRGRQNLNTDLTERVSDLNTKLGKGRKQAEQEARVDSMVESMEATAKAYGKGPGNGDNEVLNKMLDLFQQIVPILKNIETNTGKSQESVPTGQGGKGRNNVKHANAGRGRQYTVDAGSNRGRIGSVVNVGTTSVDRITRR